jgi:hypothetical protein
MLMVVSQIIYPTLLGWAVITFSTTSMVLAGAYSLKRHSGDWADDSGTIRLASLFLTLYAGACIALIYARPNRSIR